MVSTGDQLVLFYMGDESTRVDFLLTYTSSFRVENNRTTSGDTTVC